MRGNFHVQFLGGWGAAMLPGYPAWGQATVPGYPRSGKAGHMAKGDRWTGGQLVEVREMRDAETMLSSLTRPVKAVHWRAGYLEIS